MKNLLFILFAFISLNSFAQQQFEYSGGSFGTNTYTASITNMTAYTSASRNVNVSICFSNGNSGASTLNINSIGAADIVLPDGSPLSSGDIQAGYCYRLHYNGSDFVLGQTGSGGSGSSTSHNTLPPNVKTVDYELSLADTSTMVIADNAAGIEVSLTDLSSDDKGRQFVWVQPNATDTITFEANGEDLERVPFYYMYHDPDDNKYYLASGGGSSGGGGSGTVTDVTGSSPIVITGTSTLTPNVTINNAAADGSTKGAASFTANDFDASSGNIAIDYTNGQASSGSTKGFLTSTDWNTFNNKVATSRTISTTSPLTGGGDLSANRTFAINDAAADGSTKGAASFTANDFNASSGNISIDYTNGQAAASGTKGFLTGTDWDTFNGKQATGLSWLLASGGTLSGVNTIAASATNTLEFTYSGTIGTTVNRLFMVSNANAAALNAQQISPPFILRARGFATTPVASRTVDFASYVLPVQGTTQPSGVYTLAHSIDGAAWTSVLTINTSTGLTSSNSFGFIGTSGVFDTSSSTIRLRNSQGTTAGYGIKVYGGSASATSGTQTSVSIGNVADGMTFAPTSGTAVFNLLGLENTINQTGGANGAVTMLNIIPTYTAAGGNVTGIDYNPTVTSISGTHTSIRARVGNVLFDNGNLTLGTAGNKILIKEGSGGFMGQTTLVSGTKAVTVSGVTTSTRCFLTRVTPSGTTLTTDYDCVCTANTVTIQADVAAGTINTADNSTLNYMLFEPAP